MKEKIHHFTLGLFIKKQLKAAHLTIRELCKELHMSSATYEEIKRATISV